MPLMPAMPVVNSLPGECVDPSRAVDDVSMIDVLETSCNALSGSQGSTHLQNARCVYNCIKLG